MPESHTADMFPPVTGPQLEACVKEFDETGGAPGNSLAHLFANLKMQAQFPNDPMFAKFSDEDLEVMIEFFGSRGAVSFDGEDIQELLERVLHGR